MPRFNILIIFFIFSFIAVSNAEDFSADTQLQYLAMNPKLTGSDNHWLLDAKASCWVFDGYPLSGETATWSGNCKNGLADGNGTVTWFIHGVFAEKRTGNFSLGSLNGLGVATQADGTTYDGDWLYGARNGHGVLKRANGDVYDGDWPGKGEYTKADGSKCQAEVTRREGHLILVTPCAG